jgi:predicted dehydrogenase
LKDKTIDAVSVATPDFLHKEPCIDAAEAGKHILVEKPLATTVEDAEAIVKAARKAGIKLMVDFHNRSGEGIAFGEGDRRACLYIRQDQQH